MSEEKKEVQSGYLRDAEGNKSSKRLNQSLAVWGGIGIAVFAVGSGVYQAIPNALVDIGSNIMYLVLGLVSIGVTGGVGTAFSNRKK